MLDNDIKEFSGEFKIKNDKIDYNQVFLNNKSFIYSGLFYSFGLFIGAMLYKIAQSKILDSILKPKNSELSQLLTSNIFLYLAVFLFVMFLGFCLVGYQILNAVPLLIGIKTGLIIGFYFINFAIKGFAYSVVMVAPYTALFVTVISFTIRQSSDFSREILDITKGRSVNYQPKMHLKMYLVLGLVVIATAVIKSLLTNLLLDVVTI